MKNTFREAKYTIFSTDWGYFGLLAGQNGLLRTTLPMPEIICAKQHLLASYEEAVCDKTIDKDLQKRVTAYFKGAYVDFRGSFAADLSRFSPFGRAVLRSCEDISIGRTLSYSQLAEKAGSLRAARAAGNILAKNPLPLLIPCHRVICGNGRIGRFSAPGPAGLKKRLIELERRAIGV